MKLATLAPVLLDDQSLKGFNPAKLGGIELWFDARDIAGLSDGDGVATWPDKSGNGRDATQATASLRPTYKTGIQNGQPIVRGDGTDDVLETASINISWGTIFAVFGGVSNGGGAPAIGSAVWPGAPGGRLRVITIFATNTNLHADTADLHEYDVANHIHSVDGTDTDDLVDTGFHVVTLTSQAPVSDAGGVFSLMDAVSNANLAGDLAEFIAFNTILSSANEGLVEGWLKDEWATP